VGAAAAGGGGLLVAVAARLAEFKQPALVVWASEDRVMPPEHGGRLAALLADGRLVEVPDSYTLIPLDQPARLAEIIGAFVSLLRRPRTISVDSYSCHSSGKCPRSYQARRGEGRITPAPDFARCR
jgi:hypothetical protein